MDRLVAARKLIGELVKAEQIEVRRAEIVGRDLATLVETLGRPPSGAELEDWLGEHAQVTELYAAANLLDELVARYLTPPPGITVEARHAELEHQLRESPESREAHLVYADWLQERSDPLGELIALGVASASGDDDDLARFERCLKRHEAHFLGGVSGQLADRLALRWRHGLVHAIDELGDAPPALWERVLQLRVCEHLRAITLRHKCSPQLATVISAAPQTLRSLSLEACHGRLPAPAIRHGLRSLAIGGGTITISSETFPDSLEHLELRVDAIEGAALELGVRELTVALTPPVAALLRGAKLPRLERLALGIDAVSIATVVQLLSALDLPALTRLALCDGVLDGAGFGELAKLPLAARLTSLALTNLELDDDAMRALVAHRAGFASLGELDVSNNELTREGLAAARELAGTVVNQRQHRRGNGHERRARKFAGSRLQIAETLLDLKHWKRAFLDGEIRWARYRGEAEYELFVSADLVRYGCSCPSSYQPCKHVVALALLAVRTTLREAPSHGLEERVIRRVLPSVIADPDD
ncbi:MAG: TIGR02996 domain-containing protein [Kofleriaceae bacterium]